MPLPESKRFPIQFELAASSSAPQPRQAVPMREAPPVVEERDAIVRVGKARGWQVARDEKRWVVDAGEGRRVQVEHSATQAGAILRFRRVLTTAAVPQEQQADVLRRNARTAHAGFAIGPDGRLQLVATLIESMADDSEIEGILRSMVAGGEGVSAKPAEAFDHSRYKTAAPGVLRWADEILRLALEGTGFSYQIQGSHAVVVVRLEGARKQTVHVMFDRADAAGDQLVQFVTMCGPVRQDLMLKALTGNAAIPFATIALAPFGGEENFVVVKTQLAKTADRGEALTALMNVAQTGDRIEAELTGGKDIL